MAKQTDLQRKIADIDAEITRLQWVKGYLLQSEPEQADKPKRTRTRKAPGLPKEQEPTI